MPEITIRPFTAGQVEDVVGFELRLRQEEPDWGWEIDEDYIKAVKASFSDPRFSGSLSLLAYAGGKVVGRIDSSLVPSHFDGSIKAYLDWICVLQSYRHQGIAQALMSGLRSRLKALGASNLVGIIAQNDEAQRFYRALDNAVIRNQGIWIDL